MKAHGNNAPVHLAQVVYALAIGGSEMLARRLACHLNETGRYRCSMYALDFSGTLATVLSTDGIPHSAFYRSGKLDVRLIVRLTKQLRVTGTKIVHTHHLGQLLYGGIAGRLAGARIIHTEHEFYSLSRRRSQCLLRVLSGLAYIVTTVARPVTEFLRDKIGIPDRKLQTIPSGVHLALFQSARPFPRGSFGWDDRDVVIGCVARLEPEKGHRVLLDAFAHVHARYPSARLLLVGDGGLRKALMEATDSLKLHHAVKFAGLRNDVPNVLAGCDLVVLASFNEGLPLAIVEAMAAGKAVVATRIGGIPDLVLDGRTGFLVPPGNAAALAAALDRLIGDGPLRQQFGTTASEIAAEQFNLDRSVEAYDAVYRLALSGRDGR